MEYPFRTAAQVRLDDDGRILEDDLTCLHCGYNLRGLLPEGDCPECGTAVARSTHGSLLRFCDPDNNEQFLQLKIGDWIRSVAEEYPNAMLEHGGFRYPEADRVVSELAGDFAHHFSTTNGASDIALYNLGLNPQLGLTMEVLYNDEAHLRKLAADRGRPLLLFPGEMPLITTRNERAEYVLWRVLDRPRELRILGTPGGGAPPELRVARLVPEAQLEIRLQGEQKRYGIEPAEAAIYNGQTGQWQRKAISIQDVASAGHRVPLAFQTAVITLQLTDPSADAVMVVAPGGAPLLVGLQTARVAP